MYTQTLSFYNLVGNYNYLSERIGQIRHQQISPTYADNVIFGIIAKLDQRQSSVPGKRSHAAMEDEDEAYEAFLNSLSTNNQVNGYDRYVRNLI